MVSFKGKIDNAQIKNIKANIAILIWPPLLNCKIKFVMSGDIIPPILPKIPTNPLPIPLISVGKDSGIRVKKEQYPIERKRVIDPVIK